MIELDEAFAPYDHVLGISAKAMRRYWRRAARMELTRGHWRSFFEALQNSTKRFPPSHWKNGESLIRLMLQ